jgi:CubicO group peptidase (beta-lactamase class C family)
MNRIARSSPARSWSWLFLLLASVLLLTTGCRSRLTKLPPKEVRTFDSILEWSRKNGMPGAILFVQTPHTNFLGSLGYADLKQKIPMRTDHLFRIGSVTKTFTGIVAAQLHAEGRLDSEAAITNYLPREITSRIANSDRITVRQLAQHTSGIPPNNRYYWFRRLLLDKHGDWPPSREIKYLFDKPARFEPGKGWEYSNYNFLLLAMVIERVTGDDHAVEIRRRLLDPLGLTNTYYELSEAPVGQLAHGYEKICGFQSDAFDWTPVTGGNSGLVSSVSDLAKFIRAVTGNARFPDEATRNLLRNRPNPKSFDRPWFPTYGYDFGVNSAHHGDITAKEAEDLRQNPNLNPSTPVFFGHAGTVPGYLCFAWHEPRSDTTIVYFGSSGRLDPIHLRRPFEFERALETALFDMAAAPIAAGP